MHWLPQTLPHTLPHVFCMRAISAAHPAAHFATHFCMRAISAAHPAAHFATLFCMRAISAAHPAAHFATIKCMRAISAAHPAAHFATIKCMRAISAAHSAAHSAIEFCRCWPWKNRKGLRGEVPSANYDWKVWSGCFLLLWKDISQQTEYTLETAGISSKMLKMLTWTCLNWLRFSRLLTKAPLANRKSWSKWSVIWGLGYFFGGQGGLQARSWDFCCWKKKRPILLYAGYAGADNPRRVLSIQTCCRCRSGRSFLAQNVEVDNPNQPRWWRAMPLGGTLPDRNQTQRPQDLAYRLPIRYEPPVIWANFTILPKPEFRKILEGFPYFSPVGVTFPGGDWSP